MAIRADRVGVRQDQVDIHGRVTSPSFFNELLEDLPEWTDMPVWVNGTEELLPSNNSVPVTSPILADIAYPDIRRDNQYFTYRESPTLVDGLAKIKSIKGNTLVWNQRVQNGNFADTSNWLAEYTTFTVSNNVASIVGTRNGNNYIMQNYQGGDVGHKYYFRCDYYTPDAQTETLLAIYTGSTTRRTAFTPTEYGKWLTYEAIIDNDATDATQYQIRLQSRKQGVTNQFRNCMVIDLTQMGLDSITSVDEFKALFPLPFYQFEQGKLLSFNGNGIKTVSKNQFDTQVITTSYDGLVLTKTQGTIRAVYSGGSQYAGFNFYGSPVFTDTFLKGKYRLSFDVKGLDTQWTIGLRRGASFVGSQAIAPTIDYHYSFTIDTEANPNCYISFARTGNKTTAYDVTFSNIQLELGTTETPYEPYASSTLSLPISTYFPTGMKSAGSVYDELTPRKAITRIGAIDLGTLTWLSGTTAISGKNRWVATVNGIKLAEAQSSTGNILNSKYNTFTWNNSFNANVGDGIAVSSTAERIAIYDESLATETAETVASSLSGVYLYYELATPVELPTMSFE